VVRHAVDVCGRFPAVAIAAAAQRALEVEVVVFA
jgi:hypothetical protein